MHSPYRLQTIAKDLVIKIAWYWQKKKIYTYRSMEQNRDTRNKSMHLWSTKIQQRRQEYTMEKRWSLQKVVLGKLDNHMYIQKARTLSHHTQT